MVRVADYLATPGGSSETVTLFVGRVDCSQAGGIHGIAEEHEDIKVHVVAADEAIAMTDRGEVDNATALIALLWLARNRESLRRRWLGGA